MRRRHLLASLPVALGLTGCSGLSTTSPRSPSEESTPTATRTQTPTPFRQLSVTGNWTTAYHDGENTAFTQSTGPRNQGERYWRTRVQSGPSLGDGRLYVEAPSTRAKYEPAIVSIDPRDGSKQWESAPGLGTYLPPTYADGTVYAMSGELAALDATTGNTEWTFQLSNLYSSAPRVEHGQVYVTNGAADDTPSTVFALDAATGDVAWRRDLDGTVRTSAAITSQSVVVNTSPGKVYALDVQDGTTRWTVTLEGAPRTPPVIGDHVHVLDGNGTVYAITQDGSIEWTSTVSSPHGNGGLASSDSLVVTATADGVTAFRANDGSTEWTAGTSAFGPPSIDTDAVYVTTGHRGKYLRVLDTATGENRWSLELANEVSQVASEQVQPPPVVVDGGAFIVAGRNLVAVGPTTGQ